MMKCLRLFAATALLFLSGAHAQVAPPFALVMVDEASERQLGYPVDRALMARAITRLADAGVRGVVLQFQYDEPGESSADSALATAMGRTRVVLAAKLEDSEPRPNQLPTRFFVNTSTANAPVTGQSGWIPIPLLSNRAAAVGLADGVRGDLIPAFGRYQDKALPSLTVAALQVAVSGAVSITPGQRVTIGGRTLALDAQSLINVSPDAFRDVDDTEYIPFKELVSERALPNWLRGKVVVIGYHGTRIHRVSTPGGSIRAHFVYWLGLVDAWKQLQ
jgi:CHASE2 domain-containing sensor protein